MEEQLKRGKSMAELAKKYSISPEGPQGGMVGWLEKGFGDVLDNAFRFKAGMRSPVIKSAFGYHILEVVGRKPSHVKAYPEVRDQIKRILMEKREQTAYFAWLEEQVRKARVFKDQDLIEGLSVETKSQ
jgi:parvulin-like peptidyl-prolyl isomerase